MLVLVTFAGCGKPVNLPKLSPVKGVVVRGGQPVQSGKLELKAQPDNPDMMVNAQVDPTGHFEVVSMDRDGKKRPGAPEGSYKLTYIPQATDHKIEPVEVPVIFTVEPKANEWTVELPN
jgi:hypothetical protein